MKLAQVAMLILSVTLGLASTSEARSIRTKATYEAQLEKPEIKGDRQSSSFYEIRKTFYSATVKINVDLKDVKNNLITVQVNGPTPRCGVVSARCIGAKPKMVSLVVPYTKFEEGQCGERIYSGFTDARPVDGDLTEITVVDNSKNRCHYLVAIPRTEVLVHEMTSGFSPEGVKESETSFSGEKLETL